MSHPHHGSSYADAPLVVTWETTQACDLACDHCRADADPDRHPDELTTSEAKALFKQVANFGETPPFFVFTGGDPLHRPDIFELIESASETGLQPAITPATTSRLTPETIERFQEAGARRMALSLDGATAQAHDAFRGEDGTFETAIEAAEHAREIGLPIQFNTTVTATTVDQLPGIAELADEFDIAMWEVFFLVPIGRGEELDQLSPAHAREVMEWLYEHSHGASYRLITVEAPFYRRVAHEKQVAAGETPRPVGTTGAGNGFVFVSHTGEVYPSGFLPQSVGNVRDESLVDLYRDAPLLTELRDSSTRSGPCGACSMVETCGGSRSRAFATTEDPTASDPLCPWT